MGAAYKSFDFGKLFQKFGSAHTRHFICTDFDKTTLPNDPHQDLSEASIMANAANWIAEEVQPVIADALAAAAGIMSCSAPIDRPAAIRERGRRDLHLLFDEHARQVTARKATAKRIEIAIRAAQNTGGPDTSIFAKRRSQLRYAMVGLVLGEGAWNGINLFISGFSGGLGRTIGIALAAAAFNVVVGSLLGDHVTRHIRQETNRFRRWLRRVPALALWSGAIAINLAMASLQTFGKQGIDAFWNATWVAITTGRLNHFFDHFQPAQTQPTSALIGAVTAALGLIVVFLISQKSSRTQSADFSDLQRDLRRETAAQKKDRSTFEQAAITLAESEKANADDLYHDFVAVVGDATASLVNIEADFAQCDALQRQILHAHEAACEQHRDAVRRSLPDVNLPTYFSQRVNYSEILTPIGNSATVRTHVDKLRRALAVLADRVENAKSDIERDLLAVLELPTDATVPPGDRKPPGPELLQPAE